MVMLQPAMAVAVMVVVAVMVMIVIMVVIVAGLEKIRLDVEDAVEVEGAALQDVRQRNLAALGAVQFGIRVDAANPRLDLGELTLGDEVRLVQPDDIGGREPA